MAFQRCLNSFLFTLSTECSSNSYDFLALFEPSVFKTWIGCKLLELVYLNN